MNVVVCKNVNEYKRRVIKTTTKEESSDIFSRIIERTPLIKVVVDVIGDRQ